MSTRRTAIQRKIIALPELAPTSFTAVHALIAAETCPVALVLASLSYEVLYANLEFQQLFATPHLSALPGADLLSLCGESVGEEFLGSVASSGIPREQLVRVQGAGHGERQWCCRAVRADGEFGTPKWLALSFSAVAPQALQPPHAHAHALQRAAAEAESLDQFGTWHLTVDSTMPSLRGAMTWSPGLAAMLRRPASDQLRPLRDWLEAMHRDDRAEVMVALQRLAHEGGEYALEYRLADGSERVIASRGRALQVPAGAPLTITGVDRDVTDSSRQARDEREQLYLQRALTECYESPAFSVDTLMRLRWCNPLFATMVRDLLGTEPELGAGLGHIFRRREQRRRVVDNLRHSLHGERRIEELAIHSPTEKARYYDLTYNPVRDAEGGIIGAAVIGADVTMRKLLEQRALRRDSTHRGHALDSSGIRRRG